MKTGFILLAALCIAATVFSGCTGTSPAAHAPTPAPAAVPRTAGSPAGAAISLSVDSLANGETLPVPYTCTGAGESPALSWQNIPSGTRSLALIVEDPDAPRGIFTHWIVYDIPPEIVEFPAGIPAGTVLADGSRQGENTAGTNGYYPPCPPAGTVHRYVFRLYALDSLIGLPDADRNAIDQAIAGHTLAETDFTTAFGR